MPTRLDAWRLEIKSSKSVETNLDAADRGSAPQRLTNEHAVQVISLAALRSLMSLCEKQVTL